MKAVIGCLSAEGKQPAKKRRARVKIRMNLVSDLKENSVIHDS
jgi:hypothetical protein